MKSTAIHNFLISIGYNSKMSNKKLLSSICIFIYKRKRLFMKIVYWNDKNSIEYLVKKLQSENIILGSSDTVLGLLANTTKEGLRKLNKIKQRSKKPYVVLIANKASLYNFVDKEKLLPIEKFINNCWPGPVTLIFKIKPSIPSFMKSKKGTIAFRVPDHAGLQKLLSHFTGLFSTSANISGTPIPQTIKEVDKHIINQVACIVTGKQRGQSSSLPSTIIDCSGEKISVVREGAYPVDELLKMAS